MTEQPGLKEAAALLWEEARRQIEEQRSTLESVRSRSVALLSVASLVAALFGSHILRGEHRWWVTVAIVVALAAFGLSALLTVHLLAPTSDWEFSQNLDSYLVDIKNEKDVTAEDVTYNLAQHSQVSRRNNEAKLKKLHCEFGWACALLGLQVLAWAVASL
jgi:hypothetical protein